MSSSHNVIIFIAIVISFLWGVGPVLQKYILNSINPKTLLLFNGLAYMICLFFYSVYHRGELYQDVTKNMNLRLFLIIMLSGTIVGFFANLLYFYVLHKKDSYIINALVCSSPLFTLIIAYLFLKEKVQLSGFIGVMCIIIGVVLIAFNDSNRNEQFIGIHD